MKVGMFQFTKPLVQCNVCGKITKAKKSTNFNGCVFILLLCIGILPGLIYGLIANKRIWICRNCHSEQVYPVDKK